MNVQSNPFLIPFCFESGHSELLPDTSDFMSACLLNCPLLLRVAAWEVSGRVAQFKPICPRLSC